MAPPDLLQEASDPSTDPARLSKLSYNEDWAVQRAARRNPSLPEAVWIDFLLMGEPEAWDNPMTPIYLITWTPNEDDVRLVQKAIKWASEELFKDPKRCLLQGNVILNAKLQEWWSTSESADHMMTFLGKWAKAKGKNSPEHREVVRILILCVRTAINLTDKDHQVLDLLEAWCVSNADVHKKVEDLAESEAVVDTVRFVNDISYNPWNAIFEILNDIMYSNGITEHNKAHAEHDRRLADLIRREMPLPPVVA